VRRRKTLSNQLVVDSPLQIVINIATPLPPLIEVVDSWVERSALSSVADNHYLSRPLARGI
jgi:hypothetical protein